MKLFKLIRTMNEIRDHCFQQILGKIIIWICNIVLECDGGDKIWNIIIEV